VTIVGDDSPLRVLARGTLVDLGPSIVWIRTDEDAGVEVRATVAVVVHRSKVEVVLGQVAEVDPAAGIVSVARVVRAD